MYCKLLNRTLWIISNRLIKIVRLIECTCALTNHFLKQQFSNNWLFYLIIVVCFFLSMSVYCKFVYILHCYIREYGFFLLRYIFLKWTIFFIIFSFQYLLKSEKMKENLRFCFDLHSCFVFVWVCKLNMYIILICEIKNCNVCYEPGFIESVRYVDFFH